MKYIIFIVLFLISTAAFSNDVDYQVGKVYETCWSTKSPFNDKKCLYVEILAIKDGWIQYNVGSIKGNFKDIRSKTLKAFRKWMENS